MAWIDLKAAVAAVIKTNGNQEITGALLQSTLNSIIDQVGANASYKGVAIPSTNPGTPDALVFYIASTQGTYSNFGGFVLDGGFAVLSNVSGSWGGTKFLKAEMDAKAAHGYSGTPKTLKQVDRELADIFAPVKNYFNKDTMVDDGHYLVSTTGLYAVATDWGVTTPIKVKASTQYTVTTPHYGAAPVVTFYDENMVQLSFLGSAPSTFMTPANCMYLRFSLYRSSSKATFNPDNVQLEEGPVATSVGTYQLVVGGEYGGAPLMVFTPEEAEELIQEVETIKENFTLYDQVFEVNEDESDNLMNPSTITPNVVLVAGGGTTGAGAGPNYDTSDFIPVSQLTSYKGLNSANAAVSFRFVCFYNASKIYISVVGSVSTFSTPANCAFARVSWPNNSNSVDPKTVGVFPSGISLFSIFAFPYMEMPFSRDISQKTPNELMSKKDVDDSINAALSPDGELLIQLASTSNSDITITGGGVTTKLAVNESTNFNGLINFASITAFGLTYGNGDDIAPIHIQSSTVGANHGWRGDVLTSAGHGLTGANVGQEWTASDGVKFTIMKVDSVDTFTVLRKNSNASIYFHSNDGWNGQATLAYGATTLTITSSVSIQYYPSVFKKYVKVFIDRREVTELGSYVAEVIDLVEEYEILNKESLRLNAVNPANALSSMNVKNTYQFRRDGVSYVFCRYKIGHELVFSSIMAAQAVMISTAGYLYAPKILPFGDAVDLRRLTLFSALEGVSRLFTDTLWEVGKIPNRVTNYTLDKSKALMLGILTDRGVGKNLGDFTRDTFEIRGSSGKTYPHPVSSSAIGTPSVGGEFFDIAMFRVYFEPVGNVDKVELPLDDKTIVLVDIHEVGNFTVKLSDKLNGKRITLTDSQNATLHGDVVVNSEIEITTTSDYAYVELEIN